MIQTGGAYLNPQVAAGLEERFGCRVVSAYDDEGWGHFGDLGRIDEDGYLRIVGRLKEVINRGGKKISVNEVENHVRAFPLAREHVVPVLVETDADERYPREVFAVEALQAGASEQPPPADLAAVVGGIAAEVAQVERVDERDVAGHRVHVRRTPVDAGSPVRATTGERHR